MLAPDYFTLAVQTSRFECRPPPVGTSPVRLKILRASKARLRERASARLLLGSAVIANVRARNHFCKGG